MAIMLSMESMRHHGAWQQKITQPPKSSRVKQFSQQLWPRYWQRPGSSALRIWLSRINRHHSDRLAGPLTPFRRRDKPGSRCPVIQFECIIAQDMTYCNGETSVIRPDLTSPGAYILFLGESLISQPSGEVHTPVWSQAFMGPIAHSDPLYEGSPVEDAALRNLRLENLRRAIAGLDVQGQNCSLSVTARS